MNTRTKTYRLTIRAILIAIIILQTMVPFLGFIPLFVTSLTIIHITAIVAAITLGTADGAFIGFIWGVGTMIRAWTSPTTPFDTLIFTNPLISLIPRILVGVVAGALFTLLYRKTKKVGISSIVAAIAASLTNTILVLGLMGLLYTTQVATMYNVNTHALFGVLLTVVGTNGIPEVIAAAIISPLLATAIFKATSLSPENRFSRQTPKKKAS